MRWALERTNSDDEEESALGWALLPEDEGLASVVQEYVGSQALDQLELDSNLERGVIVTPINENSRKGQSSEADYEAERKRRMVKLRSDSAKRTLEVIERKFPNLKKTTK